jgi:hypothetical protein
MILFIKVFNGSIKTNPMESKLPEEKSTQLPADVVEQINLSAKAFAVGMYPNFPTAKDRAEKIFEAGATEWAQWKVKHDELKILFDHCIEDLQKAKRVTQSVLKSRSSLFKQHQQLKERAERMETALKQFISYHETGLLPCRFTYEKGVEALKGSGLPAIEPILNDVDLKAWKDGKEVGDENP